MRRREDRYLLRTNLDAQQSERSWTFCIQLTVVEQALEELEHDLAVRPIFQRRSRYTQPEPEHRMLLQQLRLTLPEKPPTKMAAARVRRHAPAQGTM